MNRPIFSVVAALVIASLACTFHVDLPNVEVNMPEVETGPTETLEIDEAAPEDEAPLEVVIRMGMGELNLSGGAEELATGTIDYNVADWKPSVTRSDERLTIEQPESEGGNWGDEVVNEWNLQLGQMPLALEVGAGAYKGELDLSGLALTRLTIQDGASEAEVTFDSVNPEVMEKFTYETGASKVTLNGLANANFERMNFRGGAGDYTLDFSGELQRDAEVDIEAGVSSLTIKIPGGLTARVSVNGGLNSVSTDGDWSQSNDVYTCGDGGHTLTIDIDAGVGSVDLECDN